MDRHTDPAFFTDEEIVNFAEHLSEQGIRIYISSTETLVHPDLKDVVSDELDLKDATSASIVPMASALAEVREEDESRELQRYQVSIPYVHDESRYQQMMMMNSPDVDQNDEREQVVEMETAEETTTLPEKNNYSDAADESDVMSTSSNNQEGTEQDVASITNNEHIHDDISNEVDYEDVQKTSSECSSEDENEEDNNYDVEKNKLQTEKQQQCSNGPRKKSSYSNINAGIIAQREKIRDICNNRQMSNKKKTPVRRGNYFREVRQKCGDEPSEEEEEEQVHEKEAARPQQRQEEGNEKSESESSEGFLDTEDEQSDDLIEFETQTQRPIARKRKNNSSSLLATSEAIGSSIAKNATDGGGGDSGWITRAPKRRSKLKKSTKRVSLDTSSPPKPSSNKHKFTAAQHRNRAGRRSVGFGAAPKAVSKRKTQLSLLHMLKK